MEEAEILLQINKIYTVILRREIVNINHATTAADVAGWNSLNHMLLINSIEKHFSIKFKLKEIMGFNNVGDMIACIKGKLG